MSKQILESDTWKNTGPELEQESTTTNPPRRGRFFRKQKNYDKKIMEDLKNIYEKDGELPDMTSIEKNRRRPTLLIAGLLAFFAVLALAAWTGFFFFKPYSRFNGQGVNIRIDGPDRPKAGEVVEYEFKFRNVEKVDLAALEARLIIPEEFRILETSSPQTTEPYIWTLGTQSPNNEGAISLRGFFLGPAEGSSAFQSIATYRPINFNSDFQVIQTKQITMSGTVFDGTITGPTEAAPGDNVEYKYKIKNNGTDPIEPIEVMLESPVNFILRGAEPNPSGTNLWAIGKIEPTEEKEIKINGSFSSGARGTNQIVLKTNLKNNNNTLNHRRDTFDTNVLAGDLALGLAVNGATRNTNANLGNILNISFSFENTGDVSLGNVVMSLTVAENTNGLIDWSRAELDSGRRSGNTITWTSRELENLGTIASRGRGTFDITLPTVNTSPTGDGNDEIRISGNALIQRVNNQSTSKQIQTSPIIISFNSNLEFDAEARYFDEEGAVLGSGPLPPKVGETTSLKIFWRIGETRRTLKNVRVRTTLPSYVSWGERSNKSIGNLSWDSNSRTVSWTIPEISSARDGVEANFEVNIIPTASDVGSFMTLTGESSLDGRDDQTGNNVVRRVPSLTTDMTTDDGARGKGVVVP